MNNDDTTNKMPNSEQDDWADFDAMTDAERLAAALSDPDAQPMTEEQLARNPISRAKTIRRVLDLSQEDFAARFHIPLGTLRDWEQGRKEPDAAARAYLTVIGRNPDAVTDALASAPSARLREKGFVT
jgi:putative transcriptional regulator